MDATSALIGLMEAIDRHSWDELERFLHPEFSCRLVHTGEVFGRAAWIRFNAEYPGFERLQIEEFVGGADRAACRSHITGRGENGLDHFQCASFAQLRDGLIVRLTEVWTDVSQTAPPGTRPV